MKIFLLLGVALFVSLQAEAKSLEFNIANGITSIPWGAELNSGNGDINFFHDDQTSSAKYFFVNFKKSASDKDLKFTSNAKATSIIYCYKKEGNKYYLAASFIDFNDRDNDEIINSLNELLGNPRKNLSDERKNRSILWINDKYVSLLYDKYVGESRLYVVHVKYKDIINDEFFDMVQRMKNKRGV